MRFRSLILAILSLTFVVGCEDFVDPAQFVEPEFGDATVKAGTDNVTISSSFTRNLKVKECGIYLSSDKENFRRIAGTKLEGGEFSIAISGLSADKDYWYKAFLYNGKTEVLSELETFHTEAAAIVNPDNPDTPDDPGTVTEPTFSDPVFKAWVLRYFDKDSDGKISIEEAANVTHIDLESGEITSLKGIESFTNLTFLRCNGADFGGYGKIAKVDLRANTKLVTLDLGYNQLDSIDLSKNTALSTIILNHNSIKELKLGTQQLLTKLDCSENALKALDLSANASLITLYCNKNNIAALDLKNNVALQEIDCSENALASLDLSKATALVKLTAFGNKITFIDFTKNSALTELYCNPMDALTDIWLIRGHAYVKVDVPEATAISYKRI